MSLVVEYLFSGGSQNDPQVCLSLKNALIVGLLRKGNDLSYLVKFRGQISSTGGNITRI